MPPTVAAKYFNEQLCLRQSSDKILTKQIGVNCWDLSANVHRTQRFVSKMLQRLHPRIRLISPGGFSRSESMAVSDKVEGGGRLESW